LEKQISGSFISQYITFKSEWIDSFVDTLGGKSDYMENIQRTIDFKETSGFSEYELLGNFFFRNFRSQVDFEPNFRLERYGNSKYGGIEKVGRMPYKYLVRKKNIIAFESWDSLGSMQVFYLRKFLRKAKVSVKFLARKLRIGSLFRSRSHTQSDSPITQYIEEFISSHEKCLILQVGACDGLQNDFLREVIIAYKDNPLVDFVLIEPLPNYVDILQVNQFEIGLAILF
jgi:hypothetical protein